MFDLINDNELLNTAISNEAIAFNANPKLASRLEELFQSIIDYRDNLDYSKFGGNIPGSKQVREYRKEQVIKFATPLLTKKFPAIVTEETGIGIGKVVLEVNRPSCFFAVDLSMGDIDNVTSVIDTVTGLDDLRKKSVKISKIMQSCKWLDLSTGKFDNTKSEFKVKVDLYFDVIVSFLLNDYVHDNVQVLTAKEITAIELHEIGHVISIVERFGDTHYTLDDIHNTVNNLTKQLSPIDMLNTLKNDAIPCINKLVAEDKIAKSVGDNLVKFITKLNNIFDSDSVIVGKTIALLLFTGAMIVAYRSIVSLLLLFIYSSTLQYSPLMFLYVITLRYTIGGLDVELNKLNTTTKRSDTTVTRHNIYAMERDADEYVVRMGYGDHLATALNRVDEIQTQSLIGYRNIHFKNSYLTMYAIKLFVLVITKMNPAMVLTMTYGEQNNNSPYEYIDNRIRRILQDSVELFKNKDIPASMRDNYLSNYNNIFRQLKENGASEYTKTPSLLIKLLINTTPKELILMMTSGKLTKEYEVVLNKLEDLKRNTMYVNAAKLAQLADSK